MIASDTFIKNAFCLLHEFERTNDLHYVNKKFKAEEKDFVYECFDYGEKLKPQFFKVFKPNSDGTIHINIIRITKIINSINEFFVDIELDTKSWYRTKRYHIKNDECLLISDDMRFE